MYDIGVIGGILAEIEGNPYGQLVEHDENASTISMSFSGTGRNIAENLARIEEKVIFSSATGDDFTGRGAVRELETLGVDTSKIKLLSGQNTAAHISILNMVDDLEMAFGNTDVFNLVSKDVVDESVEAFKDCKIIGLDASLSEETLTYACEKFGDKPLFLDTASKLSAAKAKSIIGKFHTIKPDRAEAEVLSGLTILSEAQLEEAGKWFTDQGVKRVYITLAGGGVYYTDGEAAGFVRLTDMKEVTVAKFLNPKGGGDAFSAAILSGFIQGFDIKTTAEYGMTAAKIALYVKEAVNPSLSKESLEATYEEMFGKAKN